MNNTLHLPFERSRPRDAAIGATPAQSRATTHKRTQPSMGGIASPSCPASASLGTTTESAEPPTDKIDQLKAAAALGVAGLKGKETNGKEKGRRPMAK